jgi:D-inositol-3-phosphate glycosyltransferase
VRDGVSGVLVESHAPDDYARVIGDLLANDDRRRALGRGAITHASGFSWSATASDMVEVYAVARSDRERRPLAVNR